MALLPDKVSRRAAVRGTKGVGMQNHAVSEIKFFGLLGNLKEEVKLFFKEEIKLAKTELSEKVSKMSKNAVSLVIGAFIAYAGVLIFFAGIACIIAYLFERGGMNHTFANFVGFGIIGFVVIALGGVFIVKALSGFKQSKLTPEKAIDGLNHMREVAGAPPSVPEPKLEPEKKQSSDEIKAEVDATQAIMTETVNELKHRMTPRYMRQVVVGHVRHHPLRTGIIGAVTAGISALVIRKRMNHNGTHKNGETIAIIEEED